MHASKVTFILSLLTAPLALAAPSTPPLAGLNNDEWQAAANIFAASNSAQPRNAQLESVLLAKAAQLSEERKLKRGGTGGGEGLVKVRRRKLPHAKTKKSGHVGSSSKRACLTGGGQQPQQEQQAPATGGNDTSVTPGYAASPIFPMTARSSWTTLEGVAGHMSFDNALKPLTAGRLPPISSAPDGSSALMASYPAGTVKYSASTGHGYSFYTAGEHEGVDVSSASEVIMSYSIYFSDGFEFVKGGKLPGLYGGATMDEAKSCSGGRQGERDRCFSARLMWRANGAGEAYNYLPTSGNQGGGYCETAPMSKCDANFGDSIGRGTFYFQSGRWTTVTQRLKLNSPASASNGEQEIWVDGRQILNLSNLQIRVTDETKIYGIMAQTFFGGSDQSWASPKDQFAWFKDWSLGVLA